MNKVESAGDQELFGYAWGATDDNGDGDPDGGPGWISFNCKNTSSCSTSNYSVVLKTTNDLVGYAWANTYDPVAGTSTYGWLKFGGLSGFPSGSGTQSVNARLNTVNNRIEGWARFCSGTTTAFQTNSNIPGDCTGGDRTDGWDGWVALRGSISSGGLGSVYGVDASAPSSTGVRTLSGKAWGSGVNVGWIDFSGVTIGSATASLKFFINGFDTEVLSGGTYPIIVTVASAVSPTKNVHLTWIPSGMSTCTGALGSSGWAGSRDATDIITGPPHQWDTTITNNTSLPADYPFQLSCSPSTGGPSIMREGVVRVLPSVSTSLSITYGSFVNVQSVNINVGDSITLNYSSSNVTAGTCDAVNLGYNTVDWDNATLIANVSSTSPSTPPPGLPGQATRYQFKCKSKSGTDVFSNIVSVYFTENSNLRLAFFDQANPTVVNPPNVINLPYDPSGNYKVDLVWYSPTNATLKCGTTGLGATPNPVPPNWSGPLADIPYGTATNTAIRPIKLSVKVPSVTQTTFYVTCQAFTKTALFPPETAFAVVNIQSTTGGPTIDLTANPTGVPVGGTTTLSWSSPNASTSAFTQCSAGAQKLDTNGNVVGSINTISGWNSSTSLGLPPSSKSGVDVPGVDGEGIRYAISCDWSLTSPLGVTTTGKAADTVDVIIGANGSEYLDLFTLGLPIITINDGATDKAFASLNWESDTLNEYMSCQQFAYEGSNAISLNDWDDTITDGTSIPPGQSPYSGNSHSSYREDILLPNPTAKGASRTFTMKLNCFTGPYLNGAMVSDSQDLTVYWDDGSGGSGGGGKKPIYEECRNGICSNNN